MKAKKAVRTLEGIVRSVGGDLLVVVGVGRLDGYRVALAAHSATALVPPHSAIEREPTESFVLARAWRGLAPHSLLERRRITSADGTAAERAPPRIPFLALQLAHRQRDRLALAVASHRALQFSALANRHDEPNLTLDDGAAPLAPRREERDEIPRVAAVAATRKVAAAAPRIVALEAQWSELLEAATEELLGNYNDTWRQGGRHLSAAAFKKKLSPSAVQVGDGRTTVYLSSGELFADHGVEVRTFASGKTLGDSDLVSPVWRPCRGRTDAIPPKPSLSAIS